MYRIYDFCKMKPSTRSTYMGSLGLWNDLVHTQCKCNCNTVAKLSMTSTWTRFFRLWFHLCLLNKRTQNGYLFCQAISISFNRFDKCSHKILRIKICWFFSVTITGGDFKGFLCQARTNPLIAETVGTLRGVDSAKNTKNPCIRNGVVRVSCKFHPFYLCWATC